MKSFVYGALVALVSAQENFSCVIPAGDDTWETKEVKSQTTITDAASCKVAADADAKSWSEESSSNGNNFIDLCYHAGV